MKRLAVQQSSSAPRLRSPQEIVRWLGDGALDGRAAWGWDHPLLPHAYDQDVAPGEAEALLRVERAG